MSEFQLRQLPLPADALTLFAHLQGLADSFLLYSGKGFADQHFDIFSAQPTQRIHLESGISPGQLADSIFRMIDCLNQHPCGTSDLPLPGWYGLASYDLSADSKRNTSGQPALITGFYPVIFVVNRTLQTVQRIWLNGFDGLADELTARLSDAQPPAGTFQLDETFASNMTQTEYGQRFQQVQDYLHAGDCYQVNLAQRFSASFSGNPWIAYATLAQTLPAPMGGFFNAGPFQVLSLSPERFLSIRQGHVTTHPIKGTRPRHPDAVIDRQQADALRNSEKDRAENLMIVDLLRNDLGISCLPGSIRVTDLFAIESYANVHHLVSHIEGRLRPEVHPLQAFFAAFPGGSITGAPKKRAMEIIAELEPDARRFYCGSAFYCDIGGRLDSSILIRSLLCEEGKVFCWGGGGIVVDSTASAEYQETLDKVGVILRTLEALPGKP